MKEWAVIIRFDREDDEDIPEEDIQYLQRRVEGLASVLGIRACLEEPRPLEPTKCLIEMLPGSEYPEIDVLLLQQIANQINEESE